MLSSIKEVRGLPIIPPYMSGELTQSHFQRIADKNVLRMSQLNEILLAVLEHKQMDTKSTPAVAAMASMLGHPSELVKHMSFSAYFVEPAHRDSAKTVCPVCLAEGRPTSSLFADRACSICPFHSVALVYRCPSCNRRLAWGSGDYCHCACGFDLRSSPIIDIDAETHSFFLSCLLNQHLAAMSALTQLEALPHVNNHLSTTIAYFMQDGGIRDDANARAQNIFAWSPRDITNWLAIGARIGSCPIKFKDVITAIEARHILTESKPQLLSEAENLFDAVTWRSLRLLATQVRSNAIDLTPSCDVALHGTIHNSTHQLTDMQIVGLNNDLSPFLKREFQIAHSRLPSKQLSADMPEDAAGIRLSELSKSLCWVNTSDPRKLAPLSMTSMVMSFIAVGALTPWIATPLEQWHVDLRDIAGIFQKLNVRQWTKEVSIPEGAYVCRFAQVFDLTNRPSDWLDLHFFEVTRRIDALLLGIPLTLHGRTYSERQLEIPIGMCAFLSPEDCDLYCSKDVNNLLFFRMVCSSREQAVKSLQRACLRAQKHYKLLAPWAKVAARVADRYLHGEELGYSPVLQMAIANRLVAYFEQHPYRALQTAIGDVGNHIEHDKFGNGISIDVSSSEHDGSSFAPAAQKGCKLVIASPLDQDDPVDESNSIRYEVQHV